MMNELEPGGNNPTLKMVTNKPDSEYNNCVSCLSLKFLIKLQQVLSYLKISSLYSPHLNYQLSN